MTYFVLSRTAMFAIYLYIFACCFFFVCFFFCLFVFFCYSPDSSMCTLYPYIICKAKFLSEWHISKVYLLDLRPSQHFWPLKHLQPYAQQNEFIYTIPTNLFYKFIHSWKCCVYSCLLLNLDIRPLNEILFSKYLSNKRRVAVRKCFITWRRCYSGDNVIKIVWPHV